MFHPGKDDSRKRKSSPSPADKSQSAKKKSPEEKKVTGFDRGLEPEKILGESPVFLSLFSTTNMKNWHPNYES